MFTWTGLAAPRYCFCLGSLTVVADVRKPVVLTKAAQGLTADPASPRALQMITQTWGTHVFSLNLKPNMFTWWIAEATFTRYIHQSVHWVGSTQTMCASALSEATWMTRGLGWLTFVQKLQIIGHQKEPHGLHDVMSFLFFISVWKTWQLRFSVFKWKTFCTASTYITSAASSALYTALTPLGCRCANILTLVVSS